MNGCIVLVSLKVIIRSALGDHCQSEKSSFTFNGTVMVSSKLTTLNAKP